MLEAVVSRPGPAADRLGRAVVTTDESVRVEIEDLLARVGVDVPRKREGERGLSSPKSGNSG
jgi:hypothetical protein